MGQLCDLGTGPGDIPLRIAALDQDWQVTAIDLSANMIELASAAQKAQGLEDAPIQWLQADLKSTGLPSGIFQVLISNSVLHHMPSLEDVSGFWDELKRLASPGAIVLVRDMVRPNSETTISRLFSELRGVPQVGLDHYRSSLNAAFTVEEVRDQLLKAHLPLKVGSIGDRYLEIYGQV